MRSVADDVRREQREKIRAMTPAERMALVVSMADEGLTLFATAQHIDREEAVFRIRASRQHGRRTSGCMQE